MRTVFLDHQSSTPVLPEALEGMMPFFSEWFGNASSLHHQGVRARQALDRARQQFAALVHAASPEEILFTSGGTEALNLAIKGVAEASQGRGQHIVLSAIEHPAVRNSVEYLERRGFSATRVPVDHQGRLDPAAVREALRDDTILACVHHANHDVGTIEPMAEIGAILAERGVPLCVDAVASAGWLPIDVDAMGASLLVLAPHRFYGPKGVGVLYRSRRARLQSQIHGGDQEQRKRAGTENVPAIVGGGIAAEIALRELATRQEDTAAIQSALWNRLRQAIPYLALNGPPPGAERLSTNLNLSAEFTEGEGQLLSLDLAGIAVASGTSCVSRALKVSPVLEAMGVDPTLAQASIILSLGKDNQLEEVELIVSTYVKVVERLRALSPTWEEFRKGVISSRISSAAAEPLAAARAS